MLPIGFDKSRATPIATGAARVQDQQAVLFTVAIHSVGMAVESHLRPITPGRRQKSAQTEFYMLIMPMAHIHHNAANAITKHLPGTHRATTHITVARHLMDGNIGVKFRQHFAIAIVVTQMDEGIRLYFLHAAAHKAQVGMRIGKNQNFHCAPTVPSCI